MSLTSNFSAREDHTLQGSCSSDSRGNILINLPISVRLHGLTGSPTGSMNMEEHSYGTTEWKIRVSQEGISPIQESVGCFHNVQGTSKLKTMLLKNRKKIERHGLLRPHDRACHPCFLWVPTNEKEVE